MPDHEQPRKPETDRTTVAKKAAPRRAQKPDLGPDGIRHFSGSTLKRNAAGEEVMSDHLEEGEEVANPQEDDDKSDNSLSNS